MCQLFAEAARDFAAPSRLTSKLFIILVLHDSGIWTEWALDKGIQPSLTKTDKHWTLMKTGALLSIKQSCSNHEKTVYHYLPFSILAAAALSKDL